MKTPFVQGPSADFLAAFEEGVRYTQEILRQQAADPKSAAIPDPEVGRSIASKVMIGFKESPAAARSEDSSFGYIAGTLNVLGHFAWCAAKIAMLARRDDGAMH